MTIRQPIITVAGHVDHGKTSILDCFRGSSVQEGEAGGITQKISFTKFPFEQIKKSCPLIDKTGVDLKIPGFLFIDTPGHAAFTNLRKRGGGLADLAILVVDIKEGIKPQTAEVISILKANKTPFVIALNKVDTISGWVGKGGIKEVIEGLSEHVRQEFETALLTFQGALQNHGFNSKLFYEGPDFTKEIALVPCSAKTKQGIEELLFVLCGLSQKFLQEKLALGENAQGVILEIKKERAMKNIEAIIYDGMLREGREIAVATLDGGVLTTKIRAIEEILPLSNKYSPTKKVCAATGIRLRITNKEGLLSGMPFQEIKGDLGSIKEKFKKEITRAIKLDNEGVIIKADSLGSLEALLTLLREVNVKVVKAGIGQITKKDVLSAKANLKINKLDAVVVGFNVEVEECLEIVGVKILTDDVVYKLIENLEEWRKNKQAEIERERLLGLATICKLVILPKYVFRNSNPAIFGVNVLAGKMKRQMALIDESDENVAKVKAIQEDRNSVDEVEKGKEVAISLPGINFERRLKEVHYLYSNISESQFKSFRKNKDLLSQDEIRILQEIAEIKRRKNGDWGV